MPPSNPLKAFIHRFNEDRTADSICLYCFATVCSMPTEQELGAAEAVHFCQKRVDPFNKPRPYLVAPRPRPS